MKMFQVFPIVIMARAALLIVIHEKCHDRSRKSFQYSTLKPE